MESIKDIVPLDIDDRCLCNTI